MLIIWYVWIIDKFCMPWFQGLVLKGGVLNHSTAFSCCCLVQCVVCCHVSVYGYMTMLKGFYVYTSNISLISSIFWNEVGSSRDMIQIWEWWFFFSLIQHLFDVCIICLWEPRWHGIRISLILRDRSWDKCVSYAKV